MNQTNVALLLNILSTMPCGRHYFPIPQSDGNAIAKPIHRSYQTWMESTNYASAFGYIALHNDWHNVGGSIDACGNLAYNKRSGISALSAFLECSFNQARKLMCGDQLYKDLFDKDKMYTGHMCFAQYYGKDVLTITLSDVEQKLRALL